MRLRLLVISLCGLVVGSFLAWQLLSSPPTAAPPVTQTTGKALIGGPFSLVDHTGKRVTDRDFRGRKTLVYFGFTSCPDVCPSGLQAISAALDLLGPKGEVITPLFISVDPDRDTPAKLAEYVKSFHPRLVGLTGSPEEIAATAKAYRVYYKKVPDQATPGAYSVDHTSFLYLMDENGEFVRHFTHPLDPGKLAAELAKSL